MRRSGTFHGNVTEELHHEVYAPLINVHPLFCLINVRMGHMGLSQSMRVLLYKYLAQVMSPE